MKYPKLPSFRLDGKNALVTGAGRGIGMGAAIALAESGAKVTLVSRTEKELKEYLSKITDEALYAYNVYQIEGEGRSLFLKIDGDEITIMGLPIKKIKEYIKNL